MSMILVKSLYTLVLFISFIVLCFWAYSPKRKRSFHEAEMLPFTDEIKMNNKLSTIHPDKVGECAND